MTVQSESGTFRATPMQARENPEERLPPYGTFDYTVVPDDLHRNGPPTYQTHFNSELLPSPSTQYTAPRSSSSVTPALGPTQHGSASAGVLRVLPASMRRPPGVPLPIHGHARYQPPDNANMQPYHGGHRARVRSTFDEDVSLQRRILNGLSSSSAPPAAHTRPRIRESDICPICRQLLPPRAADGNESAREAHINACITSRDPASQSLSGRRQTVGQSPPHARIHMLPFIATEKDCMGEDGTVQECSICMVEYDVGDQLARLECFCKFHRSCIVEWFGRKQECPVHKIA